MQFCVKTSDKLLNDFMYGQTLSEVNMETLKTDEFPPWRNFETRSCDRRDDGSHAHDRQ